MKQNRIKFNIRRLLAGYVENFGEIKLVHELQELSLYPFNFFFRHNSVNTDQQDYFEHLNRFIAYRANN